MLIINADDWGKNRVTTDNTLACLKLNSIDSVSAMVFMDDSERAAHLARENNVDVGLHLNFIEKINKNVAYPNLVKYQEKIAKFLLKRKFKQVIYNPLLSNQFDYVYKSQYDEFLRLYKFPPTHFDGHRHMHLCTNMLVQNCIPAQSKVRRSFTFFPGEKNKINRLYRYIVDKKLQNRYICCDYFFNLPDVNDIDQWQRIIKLSKSSMVELMVHPERMKEFEFLMSPGYLDIISSIQRGRFENLS